ncbi:patatin-like phospholipase family protein [Microcoleus vaginatus]|uniref:patatin-like phospholipase family protein n=1 Tax=Microcoleus vaginatus TaxID=119532 RepID=UPI00403F4F53
MAKYTRILSIDGGGIRGIIPAQVVVSIESMLQQKSGNPEARIADYFDLIAGTSAGGILTCIYLYPDAKNPTRPSVVGRRCC